LKFDRDRLLESLDKESENAAILFKRLAETLGKRLIGDQTCSTLVWFDISEFVVHRSATVSP